MVIKIVLLIGYIFCSLTVISLCKVASEADEKLSNSVKEKL